MNKSVLSLLPIACLAAGCEDLHSVQVKTCDVQPITEPWTGSFSNPKVTINTQGKLNASPPNVCAQQGRTIEFNIVPPATATGSVAIVPKTKTDTWLIGTNSPDPGIIEIAVPTNLESDTPHDYTIMLSNGDCLDPRIHVM